MQSVKKHCFYDTLYFLVYSALKRIEIYVRVSTHDQQTLPRVEKLKEYIKNRDWTLEVAKVEKVGLSTKTRPKREEFSRLGKRREIDEILG